MKKTFAQLKRDLTVGTKLLQIKNDFGNGKVNSNIREISKKQSNSIAFKTLIDGKYIDSWLHFPNSSSEVDYNDDIFYFKRDNLMIGYKIIKEKENDKR